MQAGDATRRPTRAVAAWHHATTRSTANIHNRALQLAVSSRNKAARLRDNDTIRSAEKLTAQSTTRGTARKNNQKERKEKPTNTDYPARAVLVDVETSSLTSLVRHTFSPARRHTSVCLIPELQQFMHRL